MHAEYARRPWRDSDELPGYLDDVVEGAVFAHSFGTATAGKVLAAFMGCYDQIVEISEFSNDITGRSFSALGWSVANYVQDLEGLFAGKLEVKSRLQIVATLLREFEAAVRETWFQIAKVNDSAARHAEATGKSTGQGHKEQILYLAHRFGLDADDRDLWLSLPGKGGFSSQVHHRSVRPPSYDELLAIEQRNVQIFGLLKRLTQASNAEYGWTITYLARLLDGGPEEFDILTDRAVRYLQQSIPDNRQLRAWFLAQISDQQWIVPLAQARFLGVGQDDLVTTAADGTLQVPTVHSLRLLVRIVEDIADHQHTNGLDHVVQFSDPATSAAVDVVIDEWLSAKRPPINPRAHCDIAELLIRLGTADDAGRVHRLIALYHRHPSYCRITRFIGDLGLVRFPLQMVRLAAYLADNGNRSLAYEVADATGGAITTAGVDDEVEVFRAYCGGVVTDRRLRRRFVRQ